MAGVLFSGSSDAHAAAPDAARFGPAALSPTLTLSQAQQAELANALAELQASEIRVYYDKTKDIQDRDTYFAGINTRAEPGELFKQLGRLIRATHDHQPTYKPSKHVYPWVDVRPDGKVHSIYSDFAYDAESLILDDFRIDAERSRARRNVVGARVSARSGCPAGTTGRAGGSATLQLRTLGTSVMVRQARTDARRLASPVCVRM